MNSVPANFREIRENWGKYDVVLATFCTCLHANLIPSATYDSLESKIEFYEIIERILNGLGQKMFVPYRDMDVLKAPDKSLYLIQKVIIPTSKIVISDSEIPSPVEPTRTSRFVSMMVDAAHKVNKPVIHLYKTPCEVTETPEKDDRTDSLIRHICPIDAYFGIEAVATQAYGIGSTNHLRYKS